jgi:hypothetical protein
MAIDKFQNPKAPPAEADLKRRLGRCYSALRSILDRLGEEYEGIGEEWKFSKLSGWYVVYGRKSRRLFYLFPGDASFILKIVLGGKAMSALGKSEQPAAVVALLRSAKKYPEGHLCVLESSGVDVAVALILLRAKLTF